MDYWVLGFLWGCGRITGEYFLVQSKYSPYVQRIRDTVGPERRLFTLERDTGESWRVKIPLDNPYVQWMISHGYEGRMGNEQRAIPEFESIEQEADFLRGYFSIHFTRDSIRNRKNIVPRLRFYAAQKVLERLNHHLHDVLGTTLKKVQKHNRNNVCHVLYYTSKREVPAIIEYLRLYPPNDQEVPEEKKTAVCAAPDCENTFLKKSLRHRYCSRKCQWRHASRLKYAREKAQKKIEKPP